MEEEFNEACKHFDKDKILYLLDHKQIPSKTQFNLLLEYQKHLLSVGSPEWASGKISEIINFFVTCGYILDYNDATNATLLYIMIPRLCKYDIQFDNKFFQIFYNNAFFNKYIDSYPRLTYENIDDLELDKYGLKYLQFYSCTYSSHLYKNSFNTLKNIKQIIKKYDIKPDITCLKNACFNKRNSKLIKYYIKKWKLVPDKLCFQNLLYNKNNKFKNTTLKFLVDNLN